MKKSWKTFWTISALLAAPFAHAACPSTDACIAWKVSPGYTDGSKYPAGTSLQYRVYRVKDATTGTLLATVTSLSFTAKNEPRGVQCYVLTTVANGEEGPSSPKSCKTIRFSGPTQGAIEAPTNGAIEPKQPTQGK